MADRFRIQNNLETLRDFSAPGEEGTTRLSYTPAYLQAVDYLKKEMEAAGLRTWEDGVGNVYGELKGTDETAPVILSGSHLDTVRCSGYFDGQAGIVCALEAARMLKESGKPLRSSFQVLATIMAISPVKMAKLSWIPCGIRMALHCGKQSGNAAFQAIWK